MVRGWRALCVCGRPASVGVAPASFTTTDSLGRCGGHLATQVGQPLLQDVGVCGEAVEVDVLATAIPARLDGLARDDSTGFRHDFKMKLNKKCTN